MTGQVNLKSIAIIPARGGSKRIPKKNIKEFLGRPILAYPVESALQTGIFDEVMVSTDCPEIAEVADRCGASVPFLRSETTADEYSGPGDVVYEVLQSYEKQGIKYDVGCCILATAPLLKHGPLLDGHQLLRSGVFDAVYAIARFDSSIWRSLYMRSEGIIDYNFPEYVTQRSQDVPETFYDSGQFYWFYVSSFLRMNNKNVFGERKGAIVLDRLTVQDIDDEEDWRLAEAKARYLASEERARGE